MRHGLFSVVLTAALVGCSSKPVLDTDTPNTAPPCGNIDSDLDSVADLCDVCPGEDDTLDADGDELPDACDDCPGDAANDADGDGVCGDLDTCEGGDDAIDGDADGTPDFCDSCPLDPLNDSDADGVCGDVDQCDGGDDNLDTDADGFADFCDWCPNDPDNDADADGVCGDVDACPGFDDTADADGDALPNGCDSCPYDPDNDADADGVCGDVDACPGFDDTADADADAQPDGCDACPLDPANDADGDGMCADVDPCPNDAFNDADADGVCGDVDLCPGFDDNIDLDNNGIPDDCEGQGTAISMTPTTGTLTQDGVSVWADRGYRFVASTNFSMTGASWNCNPPAGSSLELTVYDGVSLLPLATSGPVFAAGGEAWYDVFLNYSFTAGNTYTVTFHTSMPSTLTFDRMNSGTMGYDIPPYMSGLANCSSYSDYDNVPPEYPTYCSNTWPGFMELFVGP